MTEPLLFITEQQEVSIPRWVRDLASFRRFVRSDAFPERGRIDWLAGTVEIDMSAEKLNAHGAPKAAIAARLHRDVVEPELGVIYIDRARLTSDDANLSAEPDVLVVLYESLKAGRVQVGDPDQRSDFLEVTGAADIVVECLSRSSERKDTVRLKALYHKAGVREYWLVDARNPDAAPSLSILRRRPTRWVEARRDKDGFATSEVLARPYRLIRTAEEHVLAGCRLESR